MWWERGREPSSDCDEPVPGPPFPLPLLEVEAEPHLLAHVDHAHNPRMPTIPAELGHRRRPGRSTLAPSGLLSASLSLSRPTVVLGQRWPPAPPVMGGDPTWSPTSFIFAQARASSLVLALPCPQKARETILVRPSVSCPFGKAVPPRPWQQKSRISCPHAPPCPGSWPWDGWLSATTARLPVGLPQPLRRGLRPFGVRLLPLPSWPIVFPQKQGVGQPGSPGPFLFLLWSQ